MRTLTKSGIRELTAKYRSVLKKCAILNTMVLMLGASSAFATTTLPLETVNRYTEINIKPLKPLLNDTIGHPLQVYKTPQDNFHNIPIIYNNETYYLPIDASDTQKINSFQSIINFGKGVPLKADTLPFYQPYSVFFYDNGTPKPLYFLYDDIKFPEYTSSYSLTKVNKEESTYFDVVPTTKGQYDKVYYKISDTKSSTPTTFNSDLMIGDFINQTGFINIRFENGSLIGDFINNPNSNFVLTNVNSKNFNNIIGNYINNRAGLRVDDTNINSIQGIFALNRDTALLLYNANISSIHGNFIQNSSDNAGAIENNGGTITINDSNFIENKTTDKGGAIHNWMEGTVNIIAEQQDVIFDGNTAKEAGAIHNDGMGRGDFANRFNRTGRYAIEHLEGFLSNYSYSTINLIAKGNHSIYFNKSSDSIYNNGFLNIETESGAANIQSISGEGTTNIKSGTVNIKGDLSQYIVRVAQGATLNFLGGTIAGEIAGPIIERKIFSGQMVDVSIGTAGKINIAENAMVGIANGSKLQNLHLGNNSIVNLLNDSYDKISINNLYTENGSIGKILLDVGKDGNDTIESSLINGTFTLANVNIKDTLDKDETFSATIFNGSNPDFNNFTLTDSFALKDGFVYNITQDTNNKGNVIITNTGDTLSISDILGPSNGVSTNEHKVDSLIIDSDGKLEENMGPLAPYYGEDTRKFTVFGNGHTIDGDNTYSGMDTRGEKTIVLDAYDVTMKNFKAENGSTLINGKNATTTLSNIKFYENTATNNGGAVYNEGNITFDGETYFVNNHAAEKGGAIYNAQNATISFNGKAVFKNNTSSKLLGIPLGYDIHNDGIINFNGDVALDTAIIGGGEINFLNGTALTSILDKTYIDVGQVNFEGNNTINMIVENTADAVGDHRFILTANPSQTVNGVENVEIKNDLYNMSLTEEGDVNVFVKSGEELLADTPASLQETNTISALVATSGEGTERGKAIANQISSLMQTGHKNAAVKLAEEVAPTTSQTVMGVAQGVNSILSNIAGTRMAAVGRNGGDAFVGGAMWVQGLMNHTKQDSTSNAAGFSADTNGISFGLDGKVNENLMVGFGYGYSNTDVDSGQRDIDVEGHNFFAYSEYKPNNWYINGMFNYGFSQYEEQKVAGLQGEYDVNTYAANIMTGYDFDNGITPEVGLRYLLADQDSYNDGAQRIKSDKTDVLTGVAGIKYQTNMKAKDWTFTPNLRLSATYDMMSDNSKANVSVIGGGNYQITGKRLERFGVETGVGVEATYGDWNLSLDYNGGFRKDFQSHTGMLKAKYNF